MSSDKLRKYLAYYRKTLREDPENIEARLRLAALFREMDRPSHAIEEYGMAAKLLASEGLPLEAIAACKTILELDPRHKETQFFLAKLYARVPEVTGNSVRVAQPVDDDSRRSRTQEGQGLSSLSEGSRPKIQEISREQAKVLTDSQPAIRLDSPKGTGPLSAVSAERSSTPTHSIPDSATADVTRLARPGVEEDGPSESTVMQRPGEREALRNRAAGDEQTLELGVFDLDSLGLDESGARRWDELSILDDLDEPDTLEVELSEAESPPMERQFRLSALPEIPLFGQLPRRVFVDFLDAMELQRLSAGTVVLRPDDPVSCLYVVVCGVVRVEVDLIDGRTAELARMGEGQVFGEFRLLTGKGGAARVVAETDLELLSVRDEVVYEIGRNHPAMWDVLWNFYYDRMLNHSMAASTIFGGLSAEERKLVGRHFARTEVSAGQPLFRRGQSVDYLSLVVHGSVQVEVPGKAEPKIAEILEEGAFLGVSPCALEQPATATVRARTDVVLLQMPGTIFREVIGGLDEVARAVRHVVRQRQALTSSLSDETAMSNLV